MQRLRDLMVRCRANKPPLGAAIRLEKDIEEMAYKRALVEGVTTRIQFRNESKLVFTCTASPSRGPFEGDKFVFEFRIPRRYPFVPPLVRCESRQWRTQCPCPFVAGDGTVLLPVLGKAWKPTYSINRVILDLQKAFLAPDPREAEPRTTSPRFGHGPARRLSKKRKRIGGSESTRPVTRLRSSQNAVREEQVRRAAPEPRRRRRAAKRAASRDTMDGAFGAASSSRKCARKRARNAKLSPDQMGSRDPVQRGGPSQVGSGGADPLQSRSHPVSFDHLSTQTDNTTSAVGMDI